MSANLFWKYDPKQEAAFDPRFRKATTLMRILIGGLEKTLPQDLPNKTEVFLGSLHGEIEPTFNYLKGLAQNGVGRPFLFQNSLHHSTTGFISQQLQILGPTYSLCAIDEPQKEVMAAALVQAVANRNPVLMIHADSFPEELGEVSDYSVKTEGEFLYLTEESLSTLEIISETSELKGVGHFEELYSAINSKQSFKINFQHMEIGFRVN